MCIFGWPHVFTCIMLSLVLSILIVALMLKWLFKKKGDVEERDSTDTKGIERTDGSTNSALQRKRDTTELTNNSSTESESEVKKKRA